MSQVVDLDMFYPYPPERVWQVLTDRRSLATWMMENDFEPKLGHKFQFYSHPLPGLKTIIQCEVVELQAPTRLVYTWQESTVQPSLVIWTLTPVAGGTQLRLKHHQYSYATAVATLSRPGAIAHSEQKSKLLPSTSGLDITACHASVQQSPSIPLKALWPQPFPWNYYLHHKLPSLLAVDASVGSHN